MFKIEKDWIHNGLRCVVIAKDTGNRCGYVGISENNSMYGLQYSDEIDIDEDTKKELMESSCDKMSPFQLLCTDLDNIRVEYFFYIHGGLTYSSSYFRSSYPVQSDLWWFGYDCGHYNDAKDFEIMSDKHKEIERMYSFDSGGEIRTLEYCVNECELLADMLCNFNIKIS